MFHQYIRSVRAEYVVRISSIWNDLICRPLENVRKYKPCGQTDRQTDRFAIAAAETQFYKLRIALDEMHSSAVLSFACLIFCLSRS